MATIRMRSPRFVLSSTCQSSYLLHVESHSPFRFDTISATTNLVQRNLIYDKTCRLYRSTSRKLSVDVDHTSITFDSIRFAGAD